MCGKSIIPAKGLLLAVIAVLLFCGTSCAQVVQTGLKAGFNFSWVRPDESSFRKQYDIRPLPGFNAGIVASFKMKDRFFLHTELLYTTKGRVIEGPLDLRDQVTYNYIELPLIYNVHFKGQLKMKNVRQFKWYLGIGPNFSYWLGGKGKIEHFEFADHGTPYIEYKLKFGHRPQEMGEDGDFENIENDPGIVYLTDVKRFQLGINIGAGILLEPSNGKKVMVDLRFELGHTWLGTPKSADYIYPVSYNDNLRTRNMGLRLSLLYLLEFNMDKKVRNRGKSTKRRL